MKYLLNLLLIIFCSSQSFAQEKEEIMATVHRVFEAMATNDSTLLKIAFVDSPQIYTAFTDKEGNNKLVKGDFKRFIEAVGKLKNNTWNEPIWNEKVHIDGPLASVWVDYAFYLDGEFSHCGVDAFHLVKMEEQWKIFHLTDTRRKTACKIPDHIKNRFR